MAATEQEIDAALLGVVKERGELAVCIVQTLRHYHGVTAADDERGQFVLHNVSQMLALLGRLHGITREQLQATNDHLDRAWATIDLINAQDAAEPASVPPGVAGAAR